jgi:hypothetical protein
MGLEAMSPTSGGRRELITVASVAVHVVLSLIAPEPLATAAALAVPRQRNVDPLRAALATSAQPKGRRLLDLIAASPMAKSLVHSFIAATDRKERAAAKAQILAPFTRQYSLRIFNECFEADGIRVTRHEWGTARWHEAVWRAGQTPPLTTTPKWRLAGHDAMIEAIDFLTNDQSLQQVAYGTRRIRKDDDSWVELPKVEFKKIPEELWKTFKKEHENAKHVSRSQFLELADMVANTTQKNYGALDSYGEQNGRQTAMDLRECCSKDFVEALRLFTCTPAEHAEVLVRIKAFSESITRSEQFIKSELSHHVPSCMGDLPDLVPAEADTEAANDDLPDLVPNCPEHCTACAFGAPSSDADPSRAAQCTEQHSHRCTECSQVHALTPSLEVLMQSARALIDSTEQAARAVGADADGDTCMPCVDDTNAAAPQPTSEQIATARAQLDSIELYMKRGLARFSAFFAHERRAVHEAQVQDMLLRDLKGNECICVADWSVRTRMPSPRGPPLALLSVLLLPL